MESFLKDKDGIKSTWRPLVSFIFILALSTFIFYIPVVFLFPELFQGSGNAFKDLHNNSFWFRISNQTALLLAALFTTYMVIVTIEKRTIQSFGLSFRAKATLVGFAIGTCTMIAYAVICFSLGYVEFSFNTIGIHLLDSFLLFFLVAFAEELIMRGYLLFKLRERFGDFLALLLTSLVFGLMHWGNDHFTWLGFANISLSGFLIGFVVFRTGSISSAIGMHWAWNFIQGPVFGFAVSGNNLTGILTPKDISMPLLTGGSFGAEGSLILIPITLISIFLVHKYLRPAQA